MLFIVTGYKGFETVLFHEVRQLLEAIDCKVTKQYGGVSIEGGLDAAYTIILNSRLANRVFLPLKTFKVDSEESLYEGAKSIAWDQHMTATGSLAVSATLSRAALTHSQYAALKVKDAIVDFFREKVGERPSVDKNHPDLRLHLNIRQQTAELSLDLSGSSLHRRGYRLEHTGAPLKEHFAASLLVQAGWNKQDYEHLIDPMCGSGTFVIEAALMKANIPPALTREYFGFNNWLQHEESVWQAVKEAAEEHIDVSLIPRMTGYDKDPKAISVSRQNAERAGLGDFLDFKVQSLYQLKPDDQHNLIIFNPPYDERLQAEEGLANLYSQMG
ncbi:MAG: methyltransferase, partial [Gammaproteobacteria bacterium]|nr:methyltransferase [Gammaproteobacteria bacterium]